MIKFLILFSISLLLSVSLINTPLTIGFIIFLLTIVIRIILNLVFSSWLGIRVVLIYIGGLLVIFSYFIAINPNLKLRLSIVAMRMSLSFFVLSIFWFSLQNIFLRAPINYNIIISSVISTKNMWIIFFLVISLFIALIAVVKITSLKSGPLRPFSYV